MERNGETEEKMKQRICSIFDIIIRSSPRLRFSVSPSLILIIALFAHVLLTGSVCAEVLERIVAIVNDDVILLSEYREAIEIAKKSGSSISEETILDEMINRRLLLNEAKKFWIGVPGIRHKAGMDDSAVISEYIDRRIKAFIHIPYEDIESYYITNRKLFAGKEFYDVRDEIEDYLIKEKLSIRLREYIEELRKNSYIRIQY
ncbi:chaperone SurA [bacterium BMS3Abin06]|nr:chaperone SurA [bacterium BMS3Abin06]